MTQIRDYKANCSKCMGKYIMRNLALRDRVGGKYQRTRERSIMRQLRKYWNLQIEYLISGSAEWDVWRENEEAKIETNVAPDEVPTGDIDNLVNNLPYQEAIATAIVTDMSKAMNRGGSDTVKRYGLKEFGITFDVETNPTAQTFLKSKLDLELSNNTTNISATTKKGIKNVLVKAATDGLSHQEAGVLIRKQAQAGVFSIPRSELIAQTEIGRAYGQANNIPMTEFKALYPEQVVEKMWQTVGDDRVRTTHTDNEDDGWIPINQVHSGTGEEFAPSLDFACRCVEIYRTR